MACPDQSLIESDRTGNSAQRQNVDESADAKHNLERRSHGEEPCRWDERRHINSSPPHAREYEQRVKPDRYRDHCMQRKCFYGSVMPQPGA
jgi:hypothetical protein